MEIAIPAPVERPGPRRLRRPQRAGRRRRAAVPDRAGRRRRCRRARDGSHRPRGTCGRTRRRTSGSIWSLPSVLGFDVPTCRRPSGCWTTTIVGRRRAGDPRRLRRPLRRSPPSAATWTPTRRDARLPGAPQHVPAIARRRARGPAAWFSDRLLRALAHYGWPSSTRARRSRTRCCASSSPSSGASEQLPIVVALLEGPLSSTGLRETLDRLIEATRRRYPAIASLARGVRYRRFDRPHIDRARAEVSATMKQLAAGLVGSTDERPELMEQLVACPLPLLPILPRRTCSPTRDRPARCSRC